MIQTTRSILGKTRIPESSTVALALMKHIRIRPRNVSIRPVEMVHLRPILSAIVPAVAKPTTDATPPRMTIIDVLLVAEPIA